MQIFFSWTALLNRMSSFIGQAIAGHFLEELTEYLNCESCSNCKHSTERDARKQEPELYTKNPILYFMIFSIVISGIIFSAAASVPLPLLQIWSC